jgi:hypothetical protein
VHDPRDFVVRLAGVVGLPLATLVLGYESAFKRERAQQLVIEAPALARHGAFRRTRMLPINIPSANWTHTHSQVLSMWLLR